MIDYWSYIVNFDRQSAIHYEAIYNSAFTSVFRTNIS